ncbi:hypothetical protein ACFU9W_44765 [Streptomyces sp. NPDC057600]|uniref:hypothetical protein n=1 Tax=Streptomyces sp. NPDC057600 TaxID=3346180 RepID=UPI00368BCAAB
MLATALAIAGTLLGAIVSGLFQQASAQRTHNGARVDQARRDAVDAVTSLATTISDHRRAMWMRADARFTGATEDRVQELRDASHLTRSAVTRPHIALRLHITNQAVRDAADAMVTATYAIRDADTIDALAQARTTAIDAHDQFINTAARYLETR